jgi:hypothetical protein
MFGQNWAHQLGLGYIYPKEHIDSALRSVFTYNWTPDVATVYDRMPHRFILLANRGEPGMVGITYPKGDPPDFRIKQNDDPWTGYEYQAASHMLYEGLLTEGLTIAYGVHQRYNGKDHNPWCEIEGGDHYSRAMSAWGLLLAASGYVYDGPAGRIGFAPRIRPEDFKCFFSGAEGWGSLVQKRDARGQSNAVHVRWGEVKVNTFEIELPAERNARRVVAEVDGHPVDVRFSRDRKRLVIEPDHTLRIAANSVFKVVAAW